MVNQSEPGLAAPTPSAMQLVEEICDRFELAWKTAGGEAGRPRIEDHLAAVPEAVRPTLLRELVALDMAHRKRAGESPALDDYAARLAAPDLVRLAGFLSTQAYAAPAAGTPQAPAEPEGERQRYRIVRRHARGGLGEVFVALDRQLHREVALKEIQERYADQPESRRRFLLEAEITGSLEHPGIVPVYGLGCHADGRPFYAMRFIHGDSLKTAIDRFHQADGPGRDPGERSLALRQLLRRFVDVCNAVAYAHSRGVLHRDVKPANVMVGKYGETLVVDWGLAKTLGRPDDKAASGEGILQPPSATGHASTQAGSILGTAMYMSPEQASGRLDRLGPAGDVYSLGATLYTLLAGRPPFAGRDHQEILKQVCRGAFAPPQQVNPRTPTPLAAVCLKAMALEPEGRYASALELAADVEHWLADEPVGAWREPWTARWGRRARRHKAFVAGAAALLVTAVVALSISTVFITRAQKQEARQHQRAETNFQAALAAVDRMLTRVGEKRLAEVPQMDEVRQRLLEDALEFYQGFLQEDSNDPAVRRETARAYQRTGRIRFVMGRLEQAEADYLKALEIQDKLAHEFLSEPSYAHDLAQSHVSLGDLYGTQVGQAARAERAYRQALEVLTPLADAHAEIHEIANSLAGALHGLGKIYGATGRPREAQAAYQQALAIRSALAEQHPEIPAYASALADSCASLGELLKSTGLRDAAETEFKKGVAIREQLARVHATDPDYQSSLAIAYNQLAYFYEAGGRQALAAEPFEKAFQTWSRLAADHPAILEYQSSLAVSHRYLARIYFFAGRKADADRHLKESADLFGRLIARHPGQVSLALLFADGCVEIGMTMREGGDALGALRWYGRGVDLLRGVLEKEPEHARAKEGLINAYDGRSETFVRLGRRDEAVKDWDRMIDLAQGQASPEIRGHAAMAMARRGLHTRAVAEVEDMLARGLEPDNALYNFACVYSVSSREVQGDARLSPAERKTLAERYAGRSVELLAKARSAGLLKPYIDYAKNDSDFDPVKTRDDFKKLIRDVEEEARAAPAGGPR